MEDIKENKQSKQEESFSLGQFFKACSLKWKWFLISVIFFTFLGVAYVAIKESGFKRTMQVLIKDQDGGGGMGDIASSFSKLGLVSTNTNVYNELISLKSPAVMTEVVQRLGLDVNYYQKGFPHGKTLYGTNLPFKIKIPDLDPGMGGIFTIELQPDGSARLYKFKLIDADGTHKLPGEVKVAKTTPCAVKTPIGTVHFEVNEKYVPTPREKTVNIKVTRRSFLKTVESYSKKLVGDLTDRDATVIDLSIKDVSIQRADDVLNTILDVYTSKYVSDKNRMAVATSQFIDERLELIQKELGVVDSEIMNYKSQTLVPDLKESARLNLESSQSNEALLREVTAQLGMAQYVYDYVRTPSNKFKVIPVNTGATSPQLETQITTYNSTLLTRNNVAESTSATNPIVLDYDQQLAGMREAIERGLNNQVVSLQKNVASLQGQQATLRSQLASAPTQAKHLLSVERQQKVKEELYLYLLQKREENELNQTFTADNTRVITPPSGPVEPVSPKPVLTVAVMFILGLLFPAGIVYVKESTNTKVRSRKDLEHMSTPFIGEIPMVGKVENKIGKLLKIFGSKKKENNETLPARVSRGSRDVINESFRIVRGNIDFMNRDEKSHVILITSFNPGSGKSFVTFNLATSFAIKNKHVLIIDCDLRHGSASQFIGMPSRGITSYLTGTVPDWRNLVVKDEEEATLDILPIGHRPPNPAELLETPRMKTLIQEASAQYDYIFLDCPPVDIVVDTQLIAPLADSTIFVARAGLLEKVSVPEIDELYKNNRFNQMSLLLNGTVASNSRYGSRGYYASAYSVEG
ncbi:MAG: GumC family protein [Lepagella sp.]